MICLSQFAGIVPPRSTGRRMDASDVVHRGNCRDKFSPKITYVEREKEPELFDF